MLLEARRLSFAHRGPLLLATTTQPALLAHQVPRPPWQGWHYANPQPCVPLVLSLTQPDHNAFHAQQGSTAVSRTLQLAYYALQERTAQRWGRTAAVDACSAAQERIASLKGPRWQVCVHPVPTAHTIPCSELFQPRLVASAHLEHLEHLWGLRRCCSALHVRPAPTPCSQAALSVMHVTPELTALQSGPRLIRAVYHAQQEHGARQPEQGRWLSAYLAYRDRSTLRSEARRACFAAQAPIPIWLELLHACLAQSDHTAL